MSWVETMQTVFADIKVWLTYLTTFLSGIPPPITIILYNSLDPELNWDWAELYATENLLNVFTRSPWQII